MEVRIHFMLRGDAESADDAISSNRHYWRIDAETPVKGIDFRARSEIPVWR